MSWKSSNPPPHILRAIPLSPSDPNSAPGPRGHIQGFTCSTGLKVLSLRRQLGIEFEECPLCISLRICEPLGVLGLPQEASSGSEGEPGGAVGLPSLPLGSLRDQPRLSQGASTLKVPGKGQEAVGGSCSGLLRLVPGRVGPHFFGLNSMPAFGTFPSRESQI